MGEGTRVGMVTLISGIAGGMLEKLEKSPNRSDLSAVPVTKVWEVVGPEKSAHPTELVEEGLFRVTSSDDVLDNSAALFVVMVTG